MSKNWIISLLLTYLNQIYYSLNRATSTHVSQFVANKGNLELFRQQQSTSAPNHSPTKALFRDQPKTRNRFHQVPIGSVLAGTIWLIPEPKPRTEAYKQHSVSCGGLREIAVGIPDQIILEQNSFSANVIRAVIKRPPGIAITLRLSGLKNPQTFIVLI